MINYRTEILKQLSLKELEKAIEVKKTELNGLISTEGCMFLIANELGIQVEASGNEFLEPKEPYEYNIKQRKEYLYGFADKLYGLFGDLYNAYAGDGGRDFWTDEKRDMFNEIIKIAQEEAYCTQFHGISSSEIQRAIDKTKELINKIVKIELSEFDKIGNFKII